MKSRNFNGIGKYVQPADGVKSYLTGMRNSCHSVILTSTDSRIRLVTTDDDGK